MTFTTRPTLQGTFGMVSSPHWLASQSAMGILERGGNAFDAAVAAGFVLHVVEPTSTVPAARCPRSWPPPRTRGHGCSAARGPAPSGATVEHYRGLGLDLVPGSGPLAATVPGAVDAWLLLLRDHGTMTLAEVLAPAIGYAADGHPLLGRVGATVAAVQDLFEKHWPSSAEVWLAGGRPPTEGEVFRNPAYARTLQRLVDAAAGGASREGGIDAARRAWSEGFVAEAVEAFSRRPFPDSSGEVHAGLVTGEDMAGYAATWEEPATLEFAGHTIAKTRAWGQGPVLLQTLAILKALGATGTGTGILDPSTVEGAHAQIEALKLSFADREAWYGDTEVPLDDLLSPSYAEERATLVGARASLEVRPGSPGGRAPRSPATSLTGSPAAPRPAPRQIPPRGSRRFARTVRPPATPVTSTWWTGGGTSSPRCPAAVGCRVRRPFRGSGSRSGADCR